MTEISNENDDIMFLHCREPFYCGFCHHGKLTKTDTTLACGHKFHLGCLVKRYRIQEQPSCPQCTDEGPRFQCTHCGLKIQKRRDGIELFCECVYHITCVKSLMQRGTRNCTWCKKRFNHYDYDQMDENFP
ncbi:hypothetical protein AVEN_261026-1 [Araneus ventricosus]|uniref:RING-type domain-containing protein n=1 Tax=Araneus ventricosus TaxID=182803 RepID=A0A4Y2UG74_ARAVE|nr:hypothetical protein AVEN_261026-1 [Araneus ventricosus]